METTRYKVIRIDACAPNLATAETVLPAGEPVIAEIGAAQDDYTFGFRMAALGGCCA
jgi:hypothetical protein